MTITNICSMKQLHNLAKLYIHIYVIYNDTIQINNHDDNNHNSYIIHIIISDDPLRE